MATGEQPSPLKSKKISSSSSRSRNDSDTQWLLIPNNLELGARAKPSKKQRNKEKHKHFLKENLSSSSKVADGLSCKTRSSYHAFPRDKSNTATWLKDQFINEEKSKQGAYDSEEVISDSDFPQPHQQNVSFPTNQAFPDAENPEHQTPPSRYGADNENIKSVKDEFKKKGNVMVYEILSHIQEFISEAESSWQKLDLSDEPVINEAFVKLKNAVKDVEGSAENRYIHQMEMENGIFNSASPSSSTSRASNSKENIVNRDSTGNATVCNDDEQDKCNHHHDTKASDERTESLSSEDCAITDAGERVTAAEWERWKLKKKLLELQEERKIKDDLLRELCYLKDCANTVSASCAASIQKTNDKKKKKSCKVQSQSQHLKTKGTSSEDSQNIIRESDTPTSQLGSRSSCSSTSVKRDNVRKEQNSSFPARRHYEAEGRANEDPDIPAVPAAAVSPAHDNPEMQEKMKKLKVAQHHVQVIKDIVVSILETGRAGSLIPFDQLRLLTPFQMVDQYFSDEESGDESEVEKEFPLPAHLSSSEPTATNVKEVCCEGLKASLLDIDNHKPEEIEEVAIDNLETAVGKKDDLTKLQSQFQQLMQIFPSSDRKNDDPVRSSGEGAYTQKKNPPKNVVSENVQKVHSMRIVPHQDNLQLTRQNIVTMESQNQNSNSNLHNRDCNSVKKDNINNLSGKMGKLSYQNSMNSSYPDVLTASNNNMDTMSSFSYELNQNHSLPNEVERKTIFDILKRDKKKQKQYDRNQDSKMCCNSSIDSEPLEGSNSALAMDSTTLAAWGGSSTQENFEDENEEPAESLEEQDDEESISVFDKGSLGGHRSTQYSGQFTNMQHYIESVTNIPEKRQRNFHHPVYNRNPNQPAMQRGYNQPHTAQVLKTSRRPMPSPNTSAGVQRDLRDTSSCVGDTAEHCNQHLSSKFIQQLKNHIDQLNTLCQNQMLHDRTPAATVNSHPAQGYGHISNTCTPLQPAPEIALPCNQQLLLCLSQCYHALYMQQLEIQQLQRCMWHNIDGENSLQQNNLNTRNNHEEPSFHPYSVPSWSNPFNPSSHFPPDQISPLSSAAYFHMPMKPYAGHSGGSYGTASGTQPARAVIHPTSQNNISSQETLNNQVPPRTRANNFWDNFRSYSRQNLLSTSNNTKRNENVGSLVTPQVRQVYPLITNESPNRTADISNTCCNTPSFAECVRPAPNPDVQEVVNSSKKAKPKPVIAGSITFQKKDVPTNVNSCIFRNMRASRCHRLNLESSQLQSASNSSSADLIQQQPPVQDDSKIGTFNSASQNSLSQSAPETSVSNATSEISSVLSGEHKSDFLIGLFHEAQALKSDVLRQKALRMIRDLAMSERHDSDDISQAKVQNDLPLPTSKIETGSSTPSNQSCSKQPVEAVTPSPEISDNDRTLYPLSSDSVSGNVQNLPTATILPLNKRGTSRAASTGAVRKKPKMLTACFPEPVPNGLASSHDSGGSAADSVDPPKKIEAIEDIPGFITEKVVSDLVSMLPSLKRRLLRYGCSQTFWSVINDCLIDSLRTHLFFCNINLSRKSLVHLRQTVFLFLSLFTGITLSDFDSDFLKCVEEFTYENITCFIASGQFAPVPSSLDEENCSMDTENKMQELCGKMPGKSIEPASIKMSIRMPDEPIEPISMKLPTRTSEDPIEPIIIKMVPLPSEKSINYTSQCGIVTQQNIQNFSSCGNFIHEPVEVEHVSPGTDFEPGHISPEPEFGHISPEPDPEPEHISPEPEFGHISPEPDVGPFDVRCDCNPEAEIEPEVEIGTEADLAEADQSPGQQGTVGDGLSIPENWSLDHDAVLIHRMNPNTVGSIIIMDEDNNKDIGISSEGATGVQLCSDAYLDQDAVFDDIPTKLYPSEEELPQQLRDEQPLQLPSDDISPHNEFVPENNGDGKPTNPK